jgi:hypothetical protein
MAKSLTSFFDGTAKIRERFIAKVKDDFAFLFTEYSAVIVANEREYPPMFDNVLVTVAVETLRFRFVQERGEHRVDVAPGDEPEAWEALDYALMVLDPEERKPSWVSFPELARILKVHFIQLKDAFSSKKYQETSRKLAEIHIRERQQWVAAYNSKGGSGI